MIQNVTLVGAGNVAWHLGAALEDAGLVVDVVYSRNYSNAKALAERLYDAVPTDSLDFSESKSELFILMVSDNVVQQVAEEMTLPSSGAIVVHTSGAVPLEALANAGLYVGVFYPLQTFSKGKKVDFSKISICIDSKSERILDMLAEMAYKLSKKVYHLNSEERRKLHVAAVFACNFTNHMMTIAQEVMESNGMHFEMLEPLVRETVDKAFAIGPDKSQTGPAIRGDSKTIGKHLEELDGKARYQEIYKLVSESIAGIEKE
ncbi:Rossmann-like and DUF2520 domain-containing protein [Limibacter armeniacum]|uniref:Rossmann-like and DUF2520 domain-containing protein n=1 Tax=Limibacter armeniacum TaxID=466084 RepID=UPI002FE595E0